MTATVAEKTHARESPEPVPPTPRSRSAVSRLAMPARSFRAELVDLVVLALLGAAGLFGFGSAYGGSRYFLAGAVGLALGLAVAWCGTRRRWPLIVVVATTVVAFFVFGGAAAVPRNAYAGLLPSPTSLNDLADGAVQGWARLLTMSPPVGDTANLLVVPYLCGLVAGVVSLSIALRTRRPSLALPVPFTVLALSILFGTPRPASLLLQGTVFGTLALWWISHLQRDRRRIDAGIPGSRRRVGTVVTLVAAATMANFGWQLMPGANSHPRLVLRDYTEPPFDPADYPSPLVEYRHFTNGADEPGFRPKDSPATTTTEPIPVPDAEDEPPKDGWRSTTLFKVTGLPSDQRLRLATLDAYDRIVYSVGSGPQSSGYFQRVGEKLPAPPSGAFPDGEVHEVTVEVVGDGDANLYHDIWLPVPANATGISFDGTGPARADEIADALLWNTVTGTAALPVRLQAGDVYTLTAVRDAPPRREDYLEAVAAKISLPTQQVQAVSSAARDLVKHWGCAQPGEPPPEGNIAPPPTETPLPLESAYDKVAFIAQGLRVCGGLSDGSASQSGIPAYPGHSDRRLTDMVGEQATGMLGNGEQFAPLAALLSQATGVPARVVMGFRSPVESNDWRKEHGLAQHGATYEIRGSDITAWIEVALDRGNGTEWVAVREVTPTEPEPQLRPQPQPLDPDSDPPPPPPSIPPSEEGTDLDACRAADDNGDQEDPATAGSEARGGGDASTGGDASGSTCDRNDGDDEGDGFAIPAWVVKTAAGVLSPFLVVGALTAAIATIKSRRRDRRRTSGDADERVNGGWLEVTDLACDLGAPVPHRVTRREAGEFIARPEAVRLATHADAVVFGPGEPSETQVVKFWQEVDATCAAMLSGLSRFDRWKALVSLSSLRSSGQRRLEAGLGRRAASRAWRRDARPPRLPPESDVAPA